jgi:hypothetical protein
MPNEVRARGSGFGVWNKDKRRWHARKPMTMANAKKQLAIIGAADAGHPFATGQRPRLHKTLRMLKARK